MKQSGTKNGASLDRDRAEQAVANLLEALGYDSSSARLEDTPARVVKAFEEFTSARPFEISFFPNESSYAEPLIITNIEFTSLCEHHLLPFSGIAHVGYIPNKQIVGLSTLPYVVEKFAHSLQLQEPLTDEIADYLQEQLDALGVAVAIEADHMCMQKRGVRAASAKTITLAFRGDKRSDEAFRNWFYSNIPSVAKEEEK